MPGWASLQDVAALTGVTVTSEQLAQAEGTIDVEAGVIDLDVARIRLRDMEWLRYAAAYQAAWLAAQPDMFERLDVTSTGGTGSNSLDGRDTWLLLAPMARRALDRLSWRRSRSLRVKSAFLDEPAAAVSPLLETSDDRQVWRPMGGR